MKRKKINQYVGIFLTEKEVNDKTFALPRYSKDYIDRIMKSYLSLKAHEKGVSLNEVAEKAETNVQDVSSINQFLKEIKLIEIKSRLIFLSKMGLKYAQFISWENDLSAKNELEEILNDYKLTKLITSFIEKNNNVIPKDQLVTQIGIFSGKSRTNKTFSAAQHILNLLLYCEILIENESGIFSVFKKVISAKNDKDVEVLVETKPATEATKDIPLIYKISIEIIPNSQISEKEIASIILKIKELLDNYK